MASDRIDTLGAIKRKPARRTSSWLRILRSRTAVIGLTLILF